jgi:Lar family restriction alleviation protein
MDRDALQPCPFCGSKDVELSHTATNWPAVGCNECGALGPCTDLHSDKAIEAWNTRVPNAASRADAMALQVLVLEQQRDEARARGISQ